MKPTPTDEKHADARKTIARRRRQRAHPRKRTYTPKQKSIKAAYAQRKRRDDRTAWNARKRFIEATQRGESWMRGSTSTGSRGGTIIIRPTFCCLCGSFDRLQQLEGHHFAGYEPDIVLLASVLWVCRKCHAAIHVREHEARDMGHDPDDGFREFVLLMRRWAMKNAQHFAELPPLPAEYSKFSGADLADVQDGGNNRGT